MNSPESSPGGSLENSALEQMLAIEPRTGVIAFVSPALERILGFAEDGLNGRHVNELGRNRLPEADFAKFVGHAGHDLIGPLNQSSTLLALFHKRCKDVRDPDAKELAQHIESASLKISGLVKGLERYLEAIGSRRKLQTIDSNAALSGALLRLDERIGTSRAQITHADLPRLYADSAGLTTIFAELIDNAIKFCQPSEPPVIHVSARVAGPDWNFSIGDNGIGIDAHQIAKAMEPFGRIHGSDYPGAGMGLTIAKILVEAGGGRIWIESEPECGSVAHFTLRAYDAV
jgi:two-component system, chemotaxis family, sensor kinase Cph1